jgi:glycosyltransferase involved in cell wall biosynthesis
VIATDEGSIPYILDEKSGVIINNIKSLPEALEQAKKKLLSKKSALYCRQRYLDNFSLEQFEENLVDIFKDKQSV